MIRLSLLNLAGNRVRLALTGFAVFMGVSFVVGSFVVTDGLITTLDSLVEDARGDVDAQVRALSDFDEVALAERPFDESIADVIAGVEGVSVVQPGTQSAKIVPVRGNGEPVRTVGQQPILSFNWTGSTLDPLTLVAGREPDGPSEFAIDEASADREGLVVGEVYDIVGAEGRERFTLVGLTRLGDGIPLGGSVLMSFTLEEVQRLDGSEGSVRWVNVAAVPGLERDVLIRRLDAALPADLEVVSGTVVVAENQDEFGDAIGIFRNMLLGFALVAVFVSAFIISNTFNILLGQRVRQLALLRSLGATAGQIRLSAMFDALVVGAVASVLGVGGGVLLAVGLRALMNTLGFGLPAFALTVSVRTVIVAIVVGVGVTLVASLSPARRAARVSPVVGMRAGFRFGSGLGRRRTTLAVAFSVLGVAGLGVGLFGNPGNTLVMLVCLGGGAALVFVAVALFAPLFASPAAALLGAPLEHLPGRRVTGHMARENAARNEERTAATAAGLMIGLALIAMASVVAASLKDSFRAQLGSTVVGDVLVTAPGEGDFGSRLAEGIDSLEEFADVSAIRYGNVRIQGASRGVAAIDLTLLTKLIDANVIEGDPAAEAGPGVVLLSRDAATDRGVGLGDPLVVEFAETGEQTLEVGAVYENEFLIGRYVIDLSGWDRHFDASDDSLVAARIAPGVDADEARVALEPLENTFPQLNFETRDEFREREESRLDALLVIINVLLFLAIVIALLGITNTMALSVLERTREIGLMRAIGMTRRQTRSMVRLEAGVVSLFGALLGVLIGVVFGSIAVVAIPDTAIDRIAIPALTLVVYVVAATVAGLVAASLPARRAAHLDVLDAVGHL